MRINDPSFFLITDESHMARTSQAYNCADPPDGVLPYSDISGSGVVIGYVGAAFILVFIITIYYIIAYDPTLDPFRKDDGSNNRSQSIPFQSNPVDVLLLDFIRRIGRRVVKIVSFGKAPKPTRISPRLKESLIKCVLSMSDLQILTGLSILISGYAQLHSGLQCYHLHILVNLAWFSSLTHLACLTFLRNYLHNRPGERAWRLAAMGVIIIMLVIGTIPTSNYNWGSSLDLSSDVWHPWPRDYAICYFKVVNGTDPYALTLMVLSVLLVAVGFLIRVGRLYQALSVDLFRAARRRISRFFRKVLNKTYSWSNAANSPNGLRRHLVYRPLLASFLLLRAGSEVWASMFLEIWWLIGSFAWGLSRLLSKLQLIVPSSADWSFGQVAPVVLLGAPLLAIVEYILAEPEIRTSSPIISHMNPPTPNESLSLTTAVSVVPDAPDLDYYRDSKWYKHLILFIFVCIVYNTIAFLVLVNIDKTNLLFYFLKPNAEIWTWLPVYYTIVIFSYILNCLLIETFRLNGGSKLCRTIREKISYLLYFVNFFSLLICIVSMVTPWPVNRFAPWITEVYDISIYGPGVLVGFYIFISISYRICGLLVKLL